MLAPWQMPSSSGMVIAVSRWPTVQPEESASVVGGGENCSAVPDAVGGAEVAGADTVTVTVPCGGGGGVVADAAEVLSGAGRRTMPASRPSATARTRTSIHGILRARGSPDDEQDLIPLGVPEIRRLIGHVVVTPRHYGNDRHLQWSRFRRRSQARARRSHCKRRGHNPQMRLQCQGRP
ncbi:hypothetical protein OG535_28175 [Kitasatospora sp. NBC_00085]